MKRSYLNRGSLISWHGAFFPAFSLFMNQISTYLRQWLTSGSDLGINLVSGTMGF